MIINTICVGDKWLVSSGWDGKVIRWDLDSASILDSLQCDSYVNVMAFAEDESNLIVGGKDGFLVKIHF